MDILIEDLKPGKILPIFTDYQTQSPDSFIGEGRLLDLVEEGSTFLLDDNGTELEQEVYSYQNWVVEFPGLDGKIVKKRCKIRYLHTVGKSVNKKPKKESQKEYNPYYVDKFLKVNGKEIY